MSWRHGLAVGLLPLRRPPTKALLLALAHHANEYTGECWPSLERLMLFTALSKRAVRDAINEAEKLGYIRTKRGSGTTSTHYWITLPDAPTIMQSERGRTCPSTTENEGVEGQEIPAEGQEAPNGEAGDAPKQSMNNHEQPVVARPPKPELFMKAWNRMAEQLKLPTVRVLTPERERMIEERQAEYTTDDFIMVLDNVEASPFLRGQTERWSGCTFDWILKPENFLKILEGTYTNGR